MIPAGYTPLPDGGYAGPGGTGPYVWDGTTMALAATGSGGGGGGGNVVVTGPLGTQTSAASVATTPATLVSTSKSGTITAGGTAQAVAALNANRKGFEIQNQSSGDLWFSTLATAVQGQPSVKVPAGALYETPSGGAGTGAISIIGATTGQAFAAREWS